MGQIDVPQTCPVKEETKELDKLQENDKSSIYSLIFSPKKIEEEKK